jgi:hypothetical protein
LLLSKATDLLSSDEMNLFANILANINNINNQSLVFFDDINKLMDADPNILNLLDHNNGIWLGKNIDIQEFFNLNIKQADLDTKVENKSFVIDNQNIITLMGVGVKGEDE